MKNTTNTFIYELYPNVFSIVVDTISRLGGRNRLGSLTIRNPIDSSSQTFNLRELNPWFKRFKNSSYQQFLKSPTVSEFRLKVENNWRWQDHLKLVRKADYYSSVSIDQITGQCAIHYSVELLDEYDSVLEILNTLEVYSNTGYKLASLDSIAGPIQDFAVSLDTSYLIITTGGVLGEGLQLLYKAWFKIYNIKNQTCVYTLEWPDFNCYFSEISHESTSYNYLIFSVKCFPLLNPDCNFKKFIFSATRSELYSYCENQRDYNKFTDIGWYHTAYNNLLIYNTDTIKIY